MITTDSLLKHLASAKRLYEWRGGVGVCVELDAAMAILAGTQLHDLPPSVCESISELVSWMTEDLQSQGFSILAMTLASVAAQLDALSPSEKGPAGEEKC